MIFGEFYFLSHCGYRVYRYQFVQFPEQKLRSPEDSFLLSLAHFADPSNGHLVHCFPLRGKLGPAPFSASSLDAAKTMHLLPGESLGQGECPRTGKCYPLFSESLFKRRFSLKAAYHYCCSSPFLPLQTCHATNFTRNDYGHVCVSGDQLTCLPVSRSL